MNGWRLTGKASVPISGVAFRQAFGTPGGMRLDPGGVNYAVYFWVSQPQGDIIVTKNHGRSTYSATVNGEVIGRRFYTINNAAAAGVRALRMHLANGDTA